MKKTSSNPALPLSRPYLADDLRDTAGDDIVISADEAELKALAQANGIVAVRAFEARFRIVPEGRVLHLKGEVRAAITQTCVVTLEDFDSTIREEIDARFAPEERMPEAKGGSQRQRETNLSDEGLETDPPEAIADGKIDLGGVAAEFFTLGLDPYPRKPGAEFETGTKESGQKDIVEASPFAALARLKAGGKSEPE